MTDPESKQNPIQLCAYFNRYRFDRQSTSNSINSTDSMIPPNLPSLTGLNLGMISFSSLSPRVVTRCLQQSLSTEIYRDVSLVCSALDCAPKAMRLTISKSLSWWIGYDIANADFPRMKHTMDLVPRLATSGDTECIGLHGIWIIWLLMLKLRRLGQLVPSSRLNSHGPSPMDSMELLTSTEQHKGFLPGWLPHSLHFIYREEERQTIQKWNTCPRGHQDYNENKFWWYWSCVQIKRLCISGHATVIWETLSNIR